ncbi:sensor histidine kinase [Aeoliella mucimassa]|uniref:histidine kinase n=1 Tax=Aeoliella mucimassa TaxID=2527972 RepID=A0A518AGH8_9BACT|nr:HAMP domain-containing sensor histidine kinase [Aeoliella mucimassa]QDU53831.1 Sporulation kinase A [Aeoliella mucimassa]
MRLPIRYQFMVPLIVVALASLAAISAYYARRATIDTRTRVEEQLQGVAAVLAGSGFPLTDAVLHDMSHLAGAEFVLVNSRGLPVASSHEEEVGNVDSLSGKPVAKHAEEVSLGEVVELNGVFYYLASLQMADRRGGDSTQVLHMLFPQGDFNTAWRAVFLPPLLVGMATVLAVVLTTQFIAARINRVLGQLGTEVERLADGDFSPVEVPEVKDETQDLAIAVNRTAQRLVDYEAETRRTEQMRTLGILGSGLAHEMRNAATGCRMAVELHREVCQSEGDDDSLQMAMQQLQLMERQLQKYLRLGKRSDREQKSLVDLRELVGDLIGLVRSSAKHAGIDLVWQPPADPTQAMADPEQLSQAVMNLVLNAMDAARQRSATTGTNGYVRVELTRDSACPHVKLVVSDSGDGPPDRLSESLFEPFVSDKPEGVGLGLAVTRDIAENCGGSLTWHRVDNETQFVMSIPLSNEAADHA